RLLSLICFFFPAEDGIRDFHVTGVQTVLFRSESAPKAPIPAHKTGSAPAGGGGAEASVGRLGDRVGGEAHQEVPSQQVVGLYPALEAGELLGIVAVVDPHRGTPPHGAEVLEPLQARSEERR